MENILCLEVICCFSETQGTLTDNKQGEKKERDHRKVLFGNIGVKSSLSALCREAGDFIAVGQIDSQ